MTSTDEKENKRKFAWWVKDSTIELVGKLYKDDDCTSRSEFIEKAVIFYAGYLSTENAKGYLPNVVTSTLKAIVDNSDNRQKQEAEEYSTPTLKEIEEERLRKVLKETGRNITKSAEILGISRRTLYNKIEKYGL